MLFLSEPVFSDYFYGIGFEGFFFVASIDLGVLSKPNLLSKIVLILEVEVESLLSEEIDPSE